ncbi:keratin-associated protein 16-1-like isoform X2 [Galleria mellonella]|uniref:Keratin-associated protein 16-1-like isoform X2 n=1 Tax=Galleria mellonella TaxID=7137 RepID=A0A6J1WV26_GALME|nr:keratin-associated protein 16-1-like isoform X2 [Galleria mellonella]
MLFLFYLLFNFQMFNSGFSQCTSSGEPSCSRDNEVFVNCKVECPDSYCPVDDSRGIIACDPPYPCPPGCVCKYTHRRKSLTDLQCIEPQDCPPVNCTRPNEVWCSCPSPCLAEGCADVNNQPTTCNTLIKPVCNPRCVCMDGYFRDDRDICVPAEDCHAQT